MKNPVKNPIIRKRGRSDTDVFPRLTLRLSHTAGIIYNVDNRKRT